MYTIAKNHEHVSDGAFIYHVILELLDGIWDCISIQHASDVLYTLKLVVIV